MCVARVIGKWVMLTVTKLKLRGKWTSALYAKCAWPCFGHAMPNVLGHALAMLTVTKFKFVTQEVSRQMLYAARLESAVFC